MEKDFRRRINLLSSNEVSFKLNSSIKVKNSLTIPKQINDRMKMSFILYIGILYLDMKKNK